MNLLACLKENGLRGVFQEVWKFKLPKLQILILASITRHRPLDDKIVIESQDDFDCNGGALYDWLIDNGYNKQIKIVWRLYHDAPAVLPENVTCVPIYGPSWRKAWAICTAKWLTADCIIAEKVRDEQISIYATHGIFGLKNAHGLVDIPESVDWVLSPSPDMDETISWFRGIKPDKTRLAHVGFPQLDRLYSRRHSGNYRSQENRRSKTVLWMPTFRKQALYGREDASGVYPYGVPLVTTKTELQNLASVLNKADVTLVIKLHPKQDLTCIDDNVPDGIEFLTGETVKACGWDNVDLMLDANALISDYSGAVFEYSVLNRPMAFVLADLAQYRLGLVPGAERYMPGEKIMTIEELFEFIRAVGEGRDEQRQTRESFLNWFYSQHDEHSSERLAGLLGIIDRNNERRD